MQTIEFVKGISSNNIPYVKLGTGNKTMMIFTGGPGNMLPRKTGYMTKMYNPLLQDYTIYMVARRMCLPDDYTTEQIASDYGEMIESDLGGFVDVVLGESYGGMVMMHFAANYGNLSKKFIIAVAADKISTKGREVDFQFSVLLSQGKNRKAAVKITEALLPSGLRQYIMKVLFWIFGGTIIDSSSSSFKKDILIEAKAELNHSAAENLTKIKVPVLMICGDSDLYFPLDFIKETASKIPQVILKIYEGKGHMSTLSDKRFIPDILEYLN